MESIKKLNVSVFCMTVRATVCAIVCADLRDSDVCVHSIHMFLYRKGSAFSEGPNMFKVIGASLVYGATIASGAAGAAAEADTDFKPSSTESAVCIYCTRLHVLICECIHVIVSLLATKPTTCILQTTSVFGGFICPRLWKYGARKQLWGRNCTQTTIAVHSDDRLPPALSVVFGRRRQRDWSHDSGSDANQEGFQRLEP